jgi:hypothetical protein
LIFPKRVFEMTTHVEISNKVRLIFDWPKAKQLRVMGKSSSSIPHWLHKSNRGSVKRSGRNGAQKQGAHSKLWKRTTFWKERSPKARGSFEIVES